MNNKKDVISTLLGSLLLAGISTGSYADDCADIKARYWKCTRASMIGEKCADEDNVSIPPECLGGSSEPKKNENQQKSTSSIPDSPKDTRPFIYPKPDLVPKKPVKIVNIKPFVGKAYIETEEETEQFTTKLKNELLDAIKDGKKVRLQFN